jgi:hypothetical protein
MMIMQMNTMDFAYPLHCSLAYNFLPAFGIYKSKYTRQVNFEYLQNYTVRIWADQSFPEHAKVEQKGKEKERKKGIRQVLYYWLRRWTKHNN